MNCFTCAKSHDRIPAVGVCRHCGVGLCFDHLVEAQALRVGGTLYGCAHDMPRAKPLQGVPAGVAEGNRHNIAGVA